MNKAQSLMLEGPIPGQSLTDEPNNYAWENPPKFADAEDTFDYYLQKLTNPKVTDNILTMLDLGVPISVLAGTMLSRGVMEGIHTVDVKLLLKDMLSLQLKAMALAADIDFKETMDDYRDKDADARVEEMRRLAAKLKMRDALGKKDAGSELQMEVAEDIVEEPETEEPQQEMPSQGGLMSKEVQDV